MDEEEVFDNWEDIDENDDVLEKQLEDRKSKVQKEEKTASREDFTVPVLTEDTSRTTYQPQVRILKRDTAASSNQVNGDISKDAKPKKTLAEREADYAEARARIMGSGNIDDTQSQRPVRLIQQLEDMKVTENVIRQPRGPNGSKGFTSPR